MDSDASQLDSFNSQMFQRKTRLVSWGKGYGIGQACLQVHAQQVQRPEDYGRCCWYEMMEGKRQAQVPARKVGVGDPCKRYL